MQPTPELFVVYSFGFLMGAVVGLLVQTVLILVFYSAVSSRD